MSSPFVPLISLADAQRHLRLPISQSSPPTNQEQDVQDKLDHATDLIVQYLERPDDEEWTAEMASWAIDAVPRTVKAAILVQLAELYRFRGDDPDSEKRDPGFLSPMVRAMLARYRDPVLR